ncbi:MAG: hypothetical protein KJ950_11205 [Proteobacteria bacterium]|nr:hypothetical protein [Pseudomonadota bacterium]MBU1688296.1 hypothetical protein [Pseudomonadota bacterium]
MTKKYTVEPEILGATQCEKNLICLAGQVYCSVLDSLGSSMIKLECRDRLDECLHYHTYGAMHVCNCPVRNELFRKYGV